MTEAGGRQGETLGVPECEPCAHWALPSGPHGTKARAAAEQIRHLRIRKQ
jgi:hypothetical protein